MTSLETVLKSLGDKVLQIAISVLGGLLMAFEASVIYWGLCFLAIGVDIISAYCLSRRIHKKDATKSDGKFKSEYKFRVLVTMIVVLMGIMIAYYFDTLIMSGGNKAQSWVIGFFLFYEGWSILENWSSENDNKLARALQRVMVNKAERHINVPLGDILLDDEQKNSNNHEKN